MSAASRNVALYPWYKFFQNLMFWQAIWFLFFQSELSAAEAILIYVIYDMATTLLEVPSGYMSDRIGRRITLILSAIAGLTAAAMQAFGSEFWVFALAQAFLGVHFSFASGTENSLLYESLAKEGREGEIEQQEVKAWRFEFTALGLSAIIGGFLALIDLRVAYVATVAAFLVLVLVVFQFREIGARAQVADERARFQSLAGAARNPVLRWLFVIAALMYGYSHLPFVLGQPYILATLDTLGWAENAPVISGGVTAAMMVLSLATAGFAPGLRARIGLGGVLLFAFGLQLVLIAGLAASGTAIAIAFLLIRKVSDGFSRPFLVARIQSELPDEVRATYLSIQGLAGRLMFAVSLYFASQAASDVGLMSREEVRTILTVYAIFGLVFFVILAIFARHLRRNLT